VDVFSADLFSEYVTPTRICEFGLYKCHYYYYGDNHFYKDDDDGNADNGGFTTHSDSV